MTDRFESARQKLNRARKHVEDLEAEVRAFWSTNPLEIELVRTSTTAPSVYRVARIEALPDSTSRTCAASDAVIAAVASAKS